VLINVIARDATNSRDDGIIGVVANVNPSGATVNLQGSCGVII
jgi:hypothetical protein